MSDEKTVVLEVVFSKRQPAQPILNRLMKNGLRSATVLRGRVTPSNAWYQLELRGSVRAVEAAVEGQQQDGLRSARFSPDIA